MVARQLLLLYSLPFHQRTPHVTLVGARRRRDGVGPYKRLSGSFAPPPIPAPLAAPLPPPPPPPSPPPARTEWNAHSRALKAHWSSPALANATLAKRLRSRRHAVRPAPPAAADSPRARKAAAMRRLRADEAGWMRERLRDGELRRAQRADAAYLSRRQESRARQAARSYETRRRRAGAPPSAGDVRAPRTRGAAPPPLRQARPEVNGSLVGRRVEVMRNCSTEGGWCALWCAGEVRLVSNGSNIRKPGTPRAKYKPGEAVVVLWDANERVSPHLPAHESSTRLLKSKWKKVDLGGWRMESEFFFRDV